MSNQEAGGPLAVGVSASIKTNPEGIQSFVGKQRSCSGGPITLKCNSKGGYHIGPCRKGDGVSSVELTMVTQNGGLCITKPPKATWERSRGLQKVLLNARSGERPQAQRAGRRHKS